MGTGGEADVGPWSHAYGDAVDQDGKAVAVDASGEVVVVGDFEGMVDFGDGLLASAGGYDAFVVKLDPAGATLWSVGFGDSAFEQYVNAVAVGSDGKIAVAGDFRGTMTFGNLPPIVAGDGSADAYVVVFDGGGVPLWRRHAGGLQAQVASGVTFDSDGNVVVTGRFAGTTDFGSGEEVSAGGFDVFVAKYGPNGTPIGSLAIGGLEDQNGDAIAADGAGNVYVAGSFAGAVDFGDEVRTSAGGYDAFVAKLGSDVEVLWSIALGDSGTQIAAKIAADPAGNLAIAGSFEGTLVLDAQTTHVSAGAADVVLVKLEPDGSHAWSRRFGDAANQDRIDVAFDPAGGLLVAGSFVGTIDLGSGPHTSLGGDDVFVAKFAAGGASLWSLRFGDDQDQLARAIAADGDGAPVVAGTLAGAIDFGGGRLTSQGLDDVFVARLSP
jgi:hypothetical protein